MFIIIKLVLLIFVVPSLVIQILISDSKDEIIKQRAYLINPFSWLLYYGCNQPY
jgi:hypothetical protein